MHNSVKKLDPLSWNLNIKYFQELVLVLKAVGFETIVLLIDLGRSKISLSTQQQTIFFKKSMGFGLPMRSRSFVTNANSYKQASIFHNPYFQHQLVFFFKLNLIILSIQRTYLDQVSTKQGAFLIQYEFTKKRHYLHVFILCS